MDIHHQREQRKNEHIQLANNPNAVTPVSHFDDLLFIHHSLPEIAYKDVELTTSFGELEMNPPIYINAMTGGSQKTGNINEMLAEIAHETGLAMAVGSQHAGLRNELLVDTYKIVRKRNPNGVIFANIGADAPIEFAQSAIDMLEADALQIHLNVPQELTMQEGERDFLNWRRQIEQLLGIIEVPLIIKEVGFGMSKETMGLLHKMGVRYIDISGRGGTNFIWIENQRLKQNDYSYLNGWGQSTVISLLEAQPWLDRLTVFSSGGIRNPLDMVKCLALGAEAVGMAGPILRILLNLGVDKTIEQVNSWIDQIKTIMTMLGAQTVNDLRNCSIVVTKEVREWCEIRGIDVKKLANKTKKQ
jgi:isopentenyl-diphosphate Delta-isomerase